MPRTVSDSVPRRLPGLSTTSLCGCFCTPTRSRIGFPSSARKSTTITRYKHVTIHSSCEISCVIRVYYVYVTIISSLSSLHLICRKLWRHCWFSLALFSRVNASSFFSLLYVMNTKRSRPCKNLYDHDPRNDTGTRVDTTPRTLVGVWGVGGQGGELFKRYYPTSIDSVSFLGAVVDVFGKKRRNVRLLRGDCELSRIASVLPVRNV